MDRLHNAVTLGGQAGFHLHGLDRQQLIPSGDLASGLHRNRGHSPRHRCAHVSRIARLGLAACGGCCRNGFVGDAHGARLAVQLEEHLRDAFFIGLTNRGATDL